MEAYLAANPLAHPLVRATDGFRKARCSRGASGKSGGVRAIFYYLVSGDTLFLTMIYAKNEMEDLSHAQEKEVRHIAEAIKNQQQ